MGVCGVERETEAEEDAKCSIPSGEPSLFWGSEGFLRYFIGLRCRQGTADTTSLGLLPLARGWK